MFQGLPAGHSQDAGYGAADRAGTRRPVSRSHRRLSTSWMWSIHLSQNPMPNLYFTRDPSLIGPA